jgi:lysophospholipid hydrolase
MVGGTSIGSFVGGLYSRENDHVSIYGRAKAFSLAMADPWNRLADLTYPITSLFSGVGFNAGVQRCFQDTRIEDCWLPFFAGRVLVCLGSMCILGLRVGAFLY